MLSKDSILSRKHESDRRLTLWPDFLLNLEFHLPVTAGAEFLVGSGTIQ